MNVRKKSPKESVEFRYKALLKDDFFRQVDINDGIKLFTHLPWGSTVEFDCIEDGRRVVTSREMIMYFTDEEFSSLFHPVNGELKYEIMDNAFDKAAKGNAIWVHDFSKNEIVETKAIKEKENDKLILITEKGLKYDFDNYGEKWAALKL